MEKVKASAVTDADMSRANSTAVLEDDHHDHAPSGWQRWYIPLVTRT
ncbi:cytochrome c oxidase polypeptide I [Vibrio variabilis]|uniref:Cytochrome c oxidase polypeptide I n=1 Tax=Vibrio variabilis TaxID=990271 RepID=A0ABQ0JH65_9VIBR|nr:cytochrome c oxidase polypeptide I [Vibrio variabilis]